MSTRECRVSGQSAVTSLALCMLFRIQLSVSRYLSGKSLFALIARSIYPRPHTGISWFRNISVTESYAPLVTITYVFSHGDHLSKIRVSCAPEQPLRQSICMHELRHYLSESVALKYLGLKNLFPLSIALLPKTDSNIEYECERRLWYIHSTAPQKKAKASHWLQA